jgi:hypothetical protein
MKEPPQTRSTAPLTPTAPGLARNTSAAATSSGWPPWPSADSRRATCRIATGTAAVIRVSMKPGATAFAVIPRAASSGASARTQPAIPALVAA